MCISRYKCSSKSLRLILTLLMSSKVVKTRHFLNFLKFGQRSELWPFRKCCQTQLYLIVLSIHQLNEVFTCIICCLYRCITRTYHLGRKRVIILTYINTGRYIDFLRSYRYRYRYRFGRPVPNTIFYIHQPLKWLVEIQIVVD